MNSSVHGAASRRCRAQERVAEHLRRRRVQQHLARIARGVDLAREADRLERAGAVDEHRALAREAAQLGREQLGDTRPRRGIREVGREVLDARRRRGG